MTLSENCVKDFVTVILKNCSSILVRHSEGASIPLSFQNSIFRSWLEVSAQILIRLDLGTLVSTDVKMLNLKSVAQVDMLASDVATEKSSLLFRQRSLSILLVKTYRKTIISS